MGLFVTLYVSWYQHPLLIEENLFYVNGWPQTRAILTHSKSWMLCGIFFFFFSGISRIAIYMDCAEECWEKVLVPQQESKLWQQTVGTVPVLVHGLPGGGKPSPLHLRISWWSNRNGHFHKYQLLSTYFKNIPGMNWEVKPFWCIPKYDSLSQRKTCMQLFELWATRADLLTKCHFSLKERLMDTLWLFRLGMWQSFSRKWTKWACHVKKNTYC